MPIPPNEHQILKRILAAASKDPSSRSRVREFAALGVGAVLLFLGCLAPTVWHLDFRLGVVLAAFGGTFVGIGSFMQACREQSRVLLGYIDRDRIAQRIAELEQARGSGA